MDETLKEFLESIPPPDPKEQAKLRKLFEELPPYIPQKDAKPFWGLTKKTSED